MSETEVKFPAVKFPAVAKLECLSYTGTFRYHIDCQCMGRSLMCHDLVLEVPTMFGLGAAKVPVDWHRLREYQPELYEQIKAKVEAADQKARTEFSNSSTVPVADLNQ